MLLITALPKNTVANEMDSQRHDKLVAQGFTALRGDAMNVMPSGALTQKTIDAVIANRWVDTKKRLDRRVFVIFLAGRRESH